MILQIGYSSLFTPLTELTELILLTMLIQQYCAIYITNKDIHYSYKPSQFIHTLFALERFSIECRKTETKRITYQLDNSTNLKP